MQTTNIILMPERGGQVPMWFEGNNSIVPPTQKATQKACTFGIHDGIIMFNNTPPATHKNSALRGVSCFWEK